VSKLVGDKFYIKPEKPQVCELCGKQAETRPYGPNGENICYECGMANLETTEKMFSKVLDKAKTVVIVNEN
jgi:hypothetical protein